MDWVGIALGVLGIGLALLIWAFPAISTDVQYAVLVLAVIFIAAGGALFLVPLRKRAMAKRRPVPLALVSKLVASAEPLKSLDDTDNFGSAIAQLAEAGIIKVFGIPGELYGVSNTLVEIPPSHFKDHRVWVAWTSHGRYVSETYKSGNSIAAFASDSGRYFSLHASNNILGELLKLRVLLKANEETEEQAD